MQKVYCTSKLYFQNKVFWFELFSQYITDYSNLDNIHSACTDQKLSMGNNVSICKKSYDVELGYTTTEKIIKPETKTKSSYLLNFKNNNGKRIKILFEENFNSKHVYEQGVVYAICQIDKIIPTHIYSSHGKIHCMSKYRSTVINICLGIILGVILICISVYIYAISIFI